MNKDEMIKDLTSLIDSYEIKTLANARFVARQIVERFFNVGEEFTIVNAEQLNEILNSIRESGTRMGYEQVKEDAFTEGFEAGKKAVAQYYLDVAYHRITDLKEKINGAVKAIEDIAKEDGIKLW